MVGMGRCIDHDPVVSFSFGPFNFLPDAGRIGAAHIGRPVAAAVRPLHGGSLGIEVEKKDTLAVSFQSRLQRFAKVLFNGPLWLRSGRWLRPAAGR
jgi:hypothetical protein